MIIPLQISMLFNDIFVLEIQTVIFDVKKTQKYLSGDFSV